MEGYERLKRTLIRKGAIIDIYSDTMKLPNEHTAEWDFIGHKGAAAVVPVLNDGRILMVRQYRNAIERTTLEIPAGGLNSVDEMPMEAAARELEEETGYRCDHLAHLLSIYTTVAFCNEKIDIYLAKELYQGKQHLDEDEFLNVEAYTPERLVAMIREGLIMDSKTVSAILAYVNILS